MSAQTIDRIPLHSLDPSAFKKQYQEPGRPVVFTGVLNGQAGWDLGFLEQRLDRQSFPVRWYGNARNGQDKRLWKDIGSGVDVRSTPFSEYAGLLRSRQAHLHDIYLAKASLQQSPLRREAPIPGLDDRLTGLGFRPDRNNDYNLWVGPGGHVEALHYDMLDGTLIQLYGSKRLVLFPPWQTPNLYPFPSYIHLYRGLNMRSWFSQVYPDSPDLKAFPKLEKALTEKTEVTLEPGEGLFIPSGWWHEVSALGDDMIVSVNRFWAVTPRRRLLLSPSAWRVWTGFALSVPYIGASAVGAVFSANPRERLKAIRYQI
jgi:hypothetical protein